MTFKAFLAPTYGDPISLEAGSNIIGRGNEWGIKSLKVSRKHAEIIVTPETSTITLEPLGVNPTAVAHKGEAISKLPNNERVALKHGDVITMGDGISFTVIIVDDGISKMHMDTADLDATQLDTDAFDDDSTPTTGQKRMSEVEAHDVTKRARLEDIHIDTKELIYLRQLGTGSCGEVWEGVWRGTQVAIKKIFRSLLHANTLLEFEAESDMLRKLRHPNIVLFMGTCIQENDMAIVTEFMNKGSLRDVLNTTKLDRNMILKIAIDAATGMNYLHTYSPPIIHRDLKSMNLLADSSFKVKVGDFGLARFTTTAKAKTFCGTLQWTAPEVLSGIGYTTKADVYSFGVVLWELLTCGELYSGLNQAAIIAGVTKKGLRPNIPGDCPPAYAKLIFDCWETDPHLRPSFDVILARLRTMNMDNAEAAQQNQIIPQPTWEIDSSEIDVVSTIHQGDCSRVFKGKYRGQNVAIKELLKSSVKDVTEQIGEFKKELEIMATVRNPLVVFFYGATVRPSLSIVMELMEYSLFDIINRLDLPFHYDWRLVLQLSIESTRAVHALHCWKPPIIHCNLKATKLLVDKNFHVKIGGFGLSFFKSQQSGTISITQSKDSLCYVAPEIQRGQGCTIKSDTFSLAIILWELATRCAVGVYKHPYAELAHLDKNYVQAILQGLRPVIHAKIPAQLAAVITRCWDPTPESRPALSTLIQELEALLVVYTLKK